MTEWQSCTSTSRILGHEHVLPIYIKIVISLTILVIVQLIFLGWGHYQQRCHHPPKFTFSHSKVHPKPQNNQDWWCLKKPLDGPHSPTMWKTAWPIFIETLLTKLLQLKNKKNEMVRANHLPKMPLHTQIGWPSRMKVQILGTWNRSHRWLDGTW